MQTSGGTSCEDAYFGSKTCTVPVLSRVSSTLSCVNRFRLLLFGRYVANLAQSIGGGGSC